ncbi:MAG: hypothetical protein LKF81_07160 [Prevotella sp.]|jgi:hypothetical protein|nr:hypothetical protein [uncultured Prevotella sp.]MCH4241667.1 hypothetical protein [Prevotella sp.]
MSKFNVGDTVEVVNHPNEKLIGKVSVITEVTKDPYGRYFYKVKGIKDYAADSDIKAYPSTKMY